MEYGNGETNQLVWRENQNRYHDQEFNIAQDNPNVNVAILSQHVDEKDKILDFGCGEGKFGELIRSKKELLVGVDLDNTAANYAKEHHGYDRVFVFNINDKNAVPEEFEKYSDENNKFDKIALLDVLEHVIDPSDLIYKLLPYLRNKGKFLVSIPNVNNADIFLNLLRDHFNYRTAGVLDNTHAKYFTKTSFLEWIAEMNALNPWSLDCEYVGSIYAHTKYLEDIKQSLPALYNFIQLNPYFHVMQHLFVLSYSEGKVQTSHLEELLKEPAEDLTLVLNQLLEKSVEADSLTKVSILSNERKIMEDRYNAAQKGWEECSESLNQIRSYVERKEKEILELKDVLKEKEQEIEKCKIQMEELSKRSIFQRIKSKG